MTDEARKDLIGTGYLSTDLTPCLLALLIETVDALRADLARREQRRLEGVGAIPARTVRSAPSPTGGACFPNYGRAKNHSVSGASMGDLEYYAQGCRRTLADEAKVRWHTKERTLLAAIEAEIARQSGGVEPAPSRNEQPAFGGPGFADPGDDVPFASCGHRD